jgi:hypothetical protein
VISILDSYAIGPRSIPTVVTNIKRITMNVTIITTSHMKMPAEPAHERQSVSNTGLYHTRGNVKHSVGRDRESQPYPEPVRIYLFICGFI